MLLKTFTDYTIRISFKFTKKCSKKAVKSKISRKEDTSYRINGVQEIRWRKRKIKIRRISVIVVISSFTKVISRLFKKFTLRIMRFLYNCLKS
jgi:hypothetical protein